MVFYNMRASIGNIDGKELYVIKNMRNKLVLNYYSYDGRIVEKILADDLLEEFDIFIQDDNLLSLVYQDVKNNLNQIDLKAGEIIINQLNSEKFPRIFELNTIRHNENMSIIFLYSINESHEIFQIEHLILEDMKWHSFLVDQVRIREVLNPIKVIEINGGIFLAYYYENQICLKSFSDKDFQWKESIVLTDNKKKLYLDLIYDDGNFHLVYSEALDGNYIIKYKKFKYTNTLVEVCSKDISRKSNSSNPTLLINKGLIWIIWNESSRIYSRHSSDKGESWSQIKTWDELLRENIVRYKYTSNMNIEDRVIHNTFGTIYPDIRFVGFE